MLTAIQNARVDDLRFAYDELPEDAQADARQNAEEIVGLLEQTHDDLWQLGAALIRQKETVKGRWLDWLDTELSWSERKAQMLMNVAQRFTMDQYRDVARLPATAQMRLSAKSTPDDVIEDVLDQVRGGAKLTVNQVDELRRAASPKPPRPATVMQVEKALRSLPSSQALVAEPEHIADLVVGAVSDVVLETAKDNLRADLASEAVPTPPTARVVYLTPPAPVDHDRMLVRSVKLYRSYWERLLAVSDGDVDQAVALVVQMWFRIQYGDAVMAVEDTDGKALVAFDSDGTEIDRLRL